jgi:probable F420-dependent oxidoreductase
MKAVLDDDVTRARETGRSAIGPTLRVPAYRDNLRRVGFSDDDVVSGPSDRLIDALVAHGSVGDIVERVQEHLAAGADHVCVEVLPAPGEVLPATAWRELAPALCSLSSPRQS